jgi:DegV family protein with EDD domain
MENKKMKIVSDSSGDLYTLGDFPFSTAALKISAGDRQWVDDENLNIEEMVEFLLQYKGKSGSACPSPNDWVEKFEDYENVFCITISSNLSGSYNSACIAAEDYMSQYPGRKVHVFDSLSTGPEMHLIMDKIVELCNEGKSFEEIVEIVSDYKVNHCGLLFTLESMQNLANNGRVSHIAAKAAGILNIRPLGIASENGTLEMLEKPRGEKKAAQTAYEVMLKQGYNGGKVYIAHCMNPAIAKRVEEHILAEFPEAKTEIYTLGGLCSFYAEKGGLIVGFEKN